MVITMKPFILDTKCAYRLDIKRFFGRFIVGIAKLKSRKENKEGLN